MCTGKGVCVCIYKHACQTHTEGLIAGETHWAQRTRATQGECLVISGSHWLYVRMFSDTCVLLGCDELACEKPERTGSLRPHSLSGMVALQSSPYQLCCVLELATAFTDGRSWRCAADSVLPRGLMGVESCWSHCCHRAQSAPGVRWEGGLTFLTRHLPRAPHTVASFLHALHEFRVHSSGRSG